MKGIPGGGRVLAVKEDLDMEIKLGARVRMRQGSWVLGVLIALTLLFTSSLGAQSYRGSIRGQVPDPSGAVVPGASVAAKNTETGLSRSA